MDRRRHRDVRDDTSFFILSAETYQIQGEIEKARRPRQLPPSSASQRSPCMDSVPSPLSWGPFPPFIPIIKFACTLPLKIVL